MTTLETKKIDEEVMKNISSNIITSYYKDMDSYLAKHQGKLLETDVLVLVSQVINTSCLAMFYSFKDYLPDAPINYDILGQTICRTLRKSFKQITNIPSKKD